MKRTISVFGLLLASSLQAQESLPYEHTGVITSAPEQSGTIVISNQTYDVDLNTQIHGLMPGGELGPTPVIGSEIGFNMQLRDETHYVTEIWPLDNNDD